MGQFLLFEFKADLGLALFGGDSGFGHFVVPVVLGETGRAGVRKDQQAEFEIFAEFFRASFEDGWFGIGGIDDAGSDGVAVGIGSEVDDSDAGLDDGIGCACLLYTSDAADE